MHPDPACTSGTFVAGLLNPAAPVPHSVSDLKQRRYAVYRNNVTISLIRAMEANFPVVRRLLGEQYFAGLSREFVQKHPPQSPLMFHYGDAFGDFLEAQQDLRDYPYLHDVATLEQQIRISYHEADGPTLSPQILMQISEHDLMGATFVPHPAMAVVDSRYAVYAIYRTNQGYEAKPVEDIAKAESVLVVRPKHDVELQLLNNTQSVFIKSLAAGFTLEKAADAAFETSEDFDLNGAISLLLQPGTFQYIRTEKDRQ